MIRVMPRPLNRERITHGGGVGGRWRRHKQLYPNGNVDFVFYARTYAGVPAAKPFHPIRDVTGRRHGQTGRNSDMGAHKVHKVQHGLSVRISITASVNLLNKNANSKGSTHDTLMNRSNAINDSALRLKIDGALHSSHIRSIADVIHCFHLNHEWKRPNKQTDERRRKNRTNESNEREREREIQLPFQEAEANEPNGKWRPNCNIQLICLAKGEFEN